MGSEAVCPSGSDNKAHTLPSRVSEVLGRNEKQTKTSSEAIKEETGMRDGLGNSTGRLHFGPALG